MKLFISQNENSVHSRDNYRGNRPLLCAICRYKFRDCAEFLIDKGVNIDSQDCDGNAALHYACISSIKHPVDFLNFLIDKGANINIQNNFGETPLFTSCSENKFNSVLTLIEKGANINIPDKNGNTPLRIACCRENINIMKILIKNGADPYIQNIDGKTCFTINDFISQTIMKMCQKYPHLILKNHVSNKFY